jgi:LCP family protein required for cell wall assembly
MIGFPGETPTRRHRRFVDPVQIVAAAAAVSLVLVGISLIVRAARDGRVQAAIGATQTAGVGPAGTTAAPSDTPVLPGTPTPSATPTLTLAPTPTLPPTRTPIPTATIVIPTPIPTRAMDTGPFATPIVTPPTDIPLPAATLDVPDSITNILLLGSDNRRGTLGNTDVIMIVSVDTAEGTVSMLSIPRDLLVYVPGWTMAKINSVYAHGVLKNFPGGGFGLMQQTLLYNFGIYVGHYAMVDLNGFQGVVDVVGGIDVPVDCALQGYVLREPRLSQSDFATFEEWEAYTGNPDNWEITTLPVGVHHLDGYMALFYARFRKNLDDFDRAYRQQQVLRAIARTAQRDGLLNVTRIPQLWEQYNSLVQTSMDLGNMLQFVPVAADLSGIEIRSFVMNRQYVYGWDDPTTQINEYYLLPDPAKVGTLIAQAMQPPAQNYLVSTTATVEVRNGTTVPRLDEVAADRLLWQGLNATATGAADSSGYEQTVLYDYTGRGRSTQLAILQSELRIPDANVVFSPDPNRIYDFVVILGSNYASCTRRQPQPPLPEITIETPLPPPPPETPTATPGG